ncbi:HDOD domain-containing protein [Aquisalimonas sp.]|uniref:HDOD domain-containing protein n=1 Tax=unclassified Aquisalimonas TaxID=2644645 RepID=UPI0025C614F5|nr:HDOD domain-containing protein [Aquisalimonas sp.]
MTPDTMISRLRSLDSLPDAYYRVETLIADPYATVTAIADTLRGDPAMASRVLGVVNSAFYGFPTRVDTIPMAITIIGTRGLRDLMLGMSVTRAFRGIGTQLVSMERFWEHAIYCGLMARALGRENGQRDAEQLFLAGLFHDLGKLVIYHVMPNEAAALLREFATSEHPLPELERRHLGCTHGEVGQELLRRWNLPELFQEAAACHHAPEQAITHPDTTALVHAADALTRKVEPGYGFEPRDREPPIHPDVRPLIPQDPETMNRLRLTVDLETVELYALLFAEP